MQIGSDGLKLCPKCGERLPVGAFGKCRSRLDGLTVYCKACKNAYTRGRYNSDADLRESISKQRKERIVSDPGYRERKNKRETEYYAQRKTELGFMEGRRRRHKEWVANHPEAAKHRNRMHDARLRDDPKLRARRNERRRKRYAIDPKFKSSLQNHCARYRAVKRGNGGTYSLDDWRDMCDLAGGRCLMCGKDAPLTVDHVLPVSKGGRSNIANLQPLCQSCNAKKGATHKDYRTPNMLQWLELVTD